jgi:hypothetical protein
MSNFIDFFIGMLNIVSFCLEVFLKSQKKFQTFTVFLSGRRIHIIQNQRYKHDYSDYYLLENHECTIIIFHFLLSQLNDFSFFIFNYFYILKCYQKL